MSTINDLVIPENNQDPTKFESINEDENYVEGLWKGEDHKQPISDVYEGLNISKDDVTVIKYGAVYPDIVDDLKTATPHPQWHGYYIDNCNYIGCYQLVQRIGKGAGNIDSYTDNNPIPGLSQDDYLKIRDCFGKNSETFCGKSYASIIRNNCKLEYNMSTEAGRKQAARYRRCFIYGLSMHIMADTFAHSAYTVDGEKINHNGGSGKVGEADNTSYLPSRYECAKRGVGKTMQNLQNNTAYGYLDFATACEREYYLSDHTFYIRNIFLYAYFNGLPSNSYLYNVIHYIDLYINRKYDYTP